MAEWQKLKTTQAAFFYIYLLPQLALPRFEGVACED